MYRINSRIFCWCLLGVGVANAWADDWPGWRGLQRNAISQEVDVATTWGADEQIRWQVTLPGAGISSPVIWGERVFVTSSDGPRQDELHVICLSRTDGRELWHQRLWGTAPTRYHSTKSSMASPTPVTDGKYLYAFFGTGDLFCFEVGGKLVWQRSLASEYGPFENRFSATSSPLLYGNSVILQCDHYGDSYALAVDCKTGKDRWRRKRNDEWLSWASPQLVTVPETKRVELLLCGSLKIDGLDPDTGTTLWTVQGMQQECIPTPVIGNGLIYAVSGPGGKTLAIRPGGRGDVSESHVVWENPRGVPFVPSAILVEDLYYLINDEGIATCLDAKTGQRIWQKRLPGRYTASPIATREHVYFCNEDGETLVVEAGEKRYRQVARNRLDQPIFASPAIAHGSVFIRTSETLLCIGGE